MQFVSNGDNLHEMSNSVLLEKYEKNIISVSFAQRMVKLNSSLKTYVEGTHYIHLIEALLMSTQGMFFFFCLRTVNTCTFCTIFLKYFNLQ